MYSRPRAPRFSAGPRYGFSAAVTDDLLLVAKVADLCHTWIYRRIQDQTREQSF